MSARTGSRVGRAARRAQRAINGFLTVLLGVPSAVDRCPVKPCTATIPASADAADDPRTSAPKLSSLRPADAGDGQQRARRRWAAAPRWPAGWRRRTPRTPAPKPPSPGGRRQSAAPRPAPDRRSTGTCAHRPVLSSAGVRQRAAADPAPAGPPCPARSGAASGASPVRNRLRRRDLRPPWCRDSAHDSARRVPALVTPT